MSKKSKLRCLAALMLLAHSALGLAQTTLPYGMGNPASGYGTQSSTGSTQGDQDEQQNGSNNANRISPAEQARQTAQMQPRAMGPQQSTVARAAGDAGAPEGAAAPALPPPAPGVSGLTVFGQSLFQGRFAQESFKGFNPDYVISVGDQISLEIWGAVDAPLLLTVDSQGNIFVPRVGPVHVANVRNADLNEVMTRHIRRTYRENVQVYATVATAVPVKVFVSGYVRAPGLYAGFSSDSLLTFLDRAGGVDPLSGSYLDVRVLRSGQPLAQVNLYDFLTKGALPSLQLHDGDSIFVGQIGPVATVTGQVASSAQYEFAPGTTLGELLQTAGVNRNATNVRVTRNIGDRRQVFVVGVGDPFLSTRVEMADQIEVSVDRPIDRIAVTVQGENGGQTQYVLPYAATLADLTAQLKLTSQADPRGLQLFRSSVAQRQKAVLDSMLDNLEKSVLDAKSGTAEEASLRVQEAQLVMQFVQRSRSIVPKGQVILGEGYDPTKIVLQDGDVIRVPRESQLVVVHGEVVLPNSFVWHKRWDAKDYIEQAGGLLQKSADTRVLIMRPSGEVLNASNSSFFSGVPVRPGDEVMVLATVDSKNFQFTKELTQVLYQIAVAAGVVARL